MSSFSEHDAEQTAITARYEALPPIGLLAHELGAQLTTCENHDAALAFCARRLDEMDDAQRAGYQAAAQLKPFTVLLMLPDWLHDDQPHKSDCICRIWTHAQDPEGAIEAALGQLPRDLGWETYDPGDLNDYAPVAIYPGHLFDLFQA